MTRSGWSIILFHVLLQTWVFFLDQLLNILHRELCTTCHCLIFLFSAVFLFLHQEVFINRHCVIGIIYLLDVVIILRNSFLSFLVAAVLRYDWNFGIDPDLEPKKL